MVNDDEIETVILAWWVSSVSMDAAILSPLRLLNSTLPVSP